MRFLGGGYRRKMDHHPHGQPTNIRPVLSAEIGRPGVENLGRKLLQHFGMILRDLEQRLCGPTR